MSVQKNNSDFKAMNVAELKKYLKEKAETGLHGLPMWFLWLRRIIRAFKLCTCHRKPPPPPPRGDVGH